MSWVYILGERDGRAVKIGRSDGATVAPRLKQVNGEQMSDESFVLLAAMRGDATAETALLDYFAQWRQPRGRRREYHEPVTEIVEYVLWLRSQWFVSLDATDTAEIVAEEERNHWIPRVDRRLPAPPDDPDALFPRHLQLAGPLAGTAWAWMPDPYASFQDYFTPPDIVARASQAMGGVDLDAASHFLANKAFWQAGVHVGDYFTVNRSAFDHDWAERVWLNPPYGDYLPWFTRMADEMAAGRVRQVCMISPMWAFSTQQAREYVLAADAMVVLVPTPKFTNPANPDKTGTNQPHAIVYWGNRRAEFLAAFAEIGIACHLEELTG